MSSPTSQAGGEPSGDSEALRRVLAVALDALEEPHRGAARDLLVDDPGVVWVASGGVAHRDGCQKALGMSPVASWTILLGGLNEPASCCKEAALEPLRHALGGSGTEILSMIGLHQHLRDLRRAHHDTLHQRLQRVLGGLWQLIDRLTAPRHPELVEDARQEVRSILSGLARDELRGEALREALERLVLEPALARRVGELLDSEGPPEGARTFSILTPGDSGDVGQWAWILGRIVGQNGGHVFLECDTELLATHPEHESWLVEWSAERDETAAHTEALIRLTLELVESRDAAGALRAARGAVADRGW